MSGGIVSTALAPTQSPSRPLSQPWITRPAPSWKSNVLPRPRDESNCLPGVPAALMQQQSVSQPSEVEPLAAAAGETNVVGAEVEQTNERFTPITLQSLDTWAEKFPRLQDKLADIKMSSLIFPFKASPYLVEELVRHSAPSRSPARLRPGAARPRAAD